MKKKDRQKAYGLALIGAFIVVAWMGWIPGINLQAAFDGGDTGDTTVSYEVYTKITTRLLLSKSTTDLAVNMYDASGNFLDTVTTSSGVGTFGLLLNVGTHVWLQARQAAPATADPYVTALTEWVVPTAGQSADTVSLRNVVSGESILWLRDVGATAPTFTMRSGWDNSSIADTSNYINATDDAFKATVTVASSNTYYGGESFTDVETGKVYLGGVFLVFKTNNTHDFYDYDYIISDPSYVYYIWNIAPEGIWYDADGTIADKSVTVVITLTSGSTFTDSSSVVCDVYDLIQIGATGVPASSADFIDGGAVSTTAITTIVDSA